MAQKTLVEMMPCYNVFPCDVTRAHRLDSNNVAEQTFLARWGSGTFQNAPETLLFSLTNLWEMVNKTSRTYHPIKQLTIENSVTHITNLFQIIIEITCFIFLCFTQSKLWPQWQRLSEMLLCEY